MQRREDWYEYGEPSRRSPCASAGIAFALLHGYTHAGFDAATSREFAIFISLLGCDASRFTDGFEPQLKGP
jgi:hypothetical protein